MKNLGKYLLLTTWLFLALIEMTSYFFTDHQFVYWRAWEAVSNYTGKDSVLSPFKPLYIYRGKMTGDLLNAINFAPLPSEIRQQTFVVDEYGYRNPVGMLKNPIKSVLVGSSFTAGGQEDQANLISTLLTNTYKLPTYNYNASLQYVWFDERFKQNQPKYVLLVGTEGEIINSLPKYVIGENEVHVTPKAWNSFQEWQLENEIQPIQYDKFALPFQSYSLLRYLSNMVYIQTYNSLLSRSQIADLTTQPVVRYDQKTRMLFWQISYDDPRLGSYTKSQSDIDTAIIELKKTDQKLKSRGMQLIIVAMPSKSHLEYPDYLNIPNEQKALYHLQQQMNKAGLVSIDMLTPTIEYVKKTQQHLYYFDDSHWNTKTNELISEAIAKKIQQLEE